MIRRSGFIPELLVVQAVPQYCLIRAVSLLKKKRQKNKEQRFVIWKASTWMRNTSIAYSHIRKDKILIRSKPNLYFHILASAVFWHKLITCVEFCMALKAKALLPD
jgi:hypothetical protein